MDPVDRLAAYLAGELDADERIALEGDLVRDPALRAQLDDLRRADLALTRLHSPVPPAGFEERLHRALEPVVSEVLGTADGRAPERPRATEHPDELGARRARREPRTWLPTFVGVAAGAMILVGGGIVLSNLGGSDDGDSVAMEAMDGAEMDEGEAEAFRADPADQDGPTIVVSDRALSAGDIDALLASGELESVIARRLDPVSGSSLAEDWRDVLHDGAQAQLEEAPAAEQDAPAEDAPDAAAGDDSVPDDREAISRCANELLGDDGDPIPVYVEVATFDGEPVLVFGLVTIDPTTGVYSRPEAWVVARSDCQVLRFSQG